MFDDLIRELKNLEQGISVPITIEVDDDGYFDRQCPNAECAFIFKVLLEDWKTKVSDDIAYCPFCRHQAHSTAFAIPEQSDYFKQVAIANVQERIGQAMRASAEAFNRQPQQSFITLKFEVNSPAQVIPIPPAAKEAMTLQVACEVCQCHFAVIGAAYFCPACGHNSASQTFSQSLAIARTSMANLPTITASLLNQDAAAQVAKSLIEGTFGALVTAFQRFTEAEYPHLPHPTQTPRRNAFQNLTDGSRLWEAAGGKAYSDILDVQEMTLLRRLFQQRHLLAHQEGILDQDYLDRSGDLTYTVGQRLVIREQAVLQLADLLDKLVAGLKEDLA